LEPQTGRKRNGVSSFLQFVDRKNELTLFLTLFLKRLYERGLSGEAVRELFRLIDWRMDLPRALEQQFRQDLLAYEKEKQMPYITSVERLGREDGLREGLLDAIGLGLKLLFGAEGLQLLSQFQSLTDLDKLRALRRAVETATSLDELRTFGL
jgi:hypothetical protein